MKNDKIALLTWGGLETLCGMTGIGAAYEIMVNCIITDSIYAPAIVVPVIMTLVGFMDVDDSLVEYENKSKSQSKKLIKK